MGHWSPVTQRARPCFHERSFLLLSELYRSTHSLVQKEDGTYTLFIPKALEARIFGRTASEIGFKKGKVPVYWVYPENSVVKKEVIEEYEKQFPEITFIKVEGGHMFPLEKPVETAQLLTKLIDKTE